MTIEDLPDAVDAYLECALWAGLDVSREEGGNNPPLDENFDPDDVSDEARAEIEGELRDFIESNAEDLEGLNPDQVGHDFYLTRNGHGAGFWDRGLGAIGERLTRATKPYGTSELYPGDDQTLYLSH